MLHKSSWPTLRLARVLAQQKEAFGSFTKLAVAIEKASELKIDRRKLQRIVNGDETAPITVKDFVAIDAFLSPLGEGLADKPLFDSPWLLNGLVDRGSVLLLLGSHPEQTDRRANLSRWDLKAAATVTRQVHSAGPATGMIIDDVVFTETRPSRDIQKSLPLFADTGASVCVIGSPRACWGAELTLAEMYDVAGFSEPDPSLPFHFVWSKDLKNLYRTSTFALDPIALKEAHPEASAELSSGDTRALVVGDELYMQSPSKTGKTWKDYGVVVAQRRENGQVFIVLAGLSGPATFAAAEALVSHRTGTLPRAPEAGGHGLVRWALVEATVEDRGGRGDTRDVIATRVIETHLFP